MGSEWRELTLENAGVILIDCVHKTPAALDSGYPYIAIPQMTNGHLDYSDARKISAADYEEWTKKACPQAHDVVLSRRCNPGETAYVRGDVDFALGQNLVLLRSDGSKIYPPYLRWLARSPAWWNQIQTFLNVGAVFDSLKCADVPKFTLPIPPIGEQRRIAHILGTLDDRIELNRRMNRTLEKMAAAIFKSWFVDFDPVRAKADLPAGRQEAAVPSAERGKWFVYALECEGGRVYIGHTEDLARRFDQHMSGKGAEWTKAHPPLRVAHWETFDTQKEAVFREKKLKTGSGREWLKAEIEKNRLLAQSGLPALPAARLPDGQGQAGDIADLFPDTFEDSDLGEIPAGWAVGRLDDLLVLQRGFDLPVKKRQPGSVPVIMASGPGDYHNEYKVVGPGVVTGRSGKLGNVFLIPNNFWPLNTTLWVKDFRHSRPCHAYMVLKGLALESYNAGSAVPTLNRNHVHNLPVLLPPSGLVDAYENIALSLYRKCWANEDQNRRLAGLRDTLLPKLLSGEVEVPELENLLADGQ